MSKTYVPAGYQSVLTLYETQNAIGVIHHAFEEHLGQTLNLKRVSAPLFVTQDSGLNDNLNGYERPVSFDIPAVGFDNGRTYGQTDSRVFLLAIRDLSL